MRERLRRDRSNANGTASFAATPIDMTRSDDRKYIAAVISSSRKNTKSAWDWYDKIGEIHYGVSRSSRIGGFADLGVYKLEKNGEIGERVTTGLAGEIGSMLYSPYGGSRGLIERFLTLIKVPADCYLIEARNGREPDGFDFVSSDEIKMGDAVGLLNAESGQEIYRITLPAKSRFGETAMEERLAPAQFIGRVWRPSPRYVDLPDSPLTALETSCEVLHLLTTNLRAKLMSRLATNGIFYVPSEVNDARSSAPSANPGEFHQNKVLDELIKAAMYAAQNPGEPAAALPIFMTGPGIHGEQFRHIIMDQEIFETDMKLRAELINRVLVGLDVQPQQITGSQDSNHWSAWAASDDEMRVSVKPDLETMCWALTRLVLWKKMTDAGRKSGEVMRYVVGYDLSRAQSHINAAEDSRQGFDRMLIGGAAARKANGFEDRDAPTSDEYIRMLGVKISDPYLATYGMPEQENFDWSKIGRRKTGPAAASEGDTPEVGPGVGNPGSPDDNKSNVPARLRPA